MLTRYLIFRVPRRHGSSAKVRLERPESLVEIRRRLLSGDIPVERPSGRPRPWSTSYGAVPSETLEVHGKRRPLVRRSACSIRVSPIAIASAVSSARCSLRRAGAKRTGVALACTLSGPLVSSPLLPPVRWRSRVTSVAIEAMRGSSDRPGRIASGPAGSARPHNIHSSSGEAHSGRCAGTGRAIGNSTRAVVRVASTAQPRRGRAWRSASTFPVLGPPDLLGTARFGLVAARGRGEIDARPNASSARPILSDHLVRPNEGR